MIKAKKPHEVLLSVDPGTKEIGWALWRDKELIDCGIARGTHWRETVKNMPRMGPTRVLIEDQQIYRNSPIDANNLLALARVVGAVAMYYDVAHTLLVKPREWKGQVPKEIHNRRTIAKLSDTERDVLTQKSYRKAILHNLFDAVGIGLWYLNR